MRLLELFRETRLGRVDHGLFDESCGGRQKVDGLVVGGRDGRRERGNALEGVHDCRCLLVATRVRGFLSASLSGTSTRSVSAPS